MMAGIGCDEKRVISILGHRTQAQRLAVADAYHRQFGEILTHRLKSELHNNLEVCFFATGWVSR
jgi:annexin A7/11